MKPVVTRHLEPIGTEQSIVLWDKFGPDDNDLETGHEGGLSIMPTPIPPPRDPAADECRDLRQHLRVTIGEAARAMGLTVVEYSEIERGWRVPDEASGSGWGDVFVGLFQAKRDQPEPVGGRRFGLLGSSLR